MTSPVTLVLGGARSGKSAHAEELVRQTGLTRVYVATGQPFDDEMERRVEAHRQMRGENWRTLEAPLDLVATLDEADAADAAILVDCLTLWVSNLMLGARDVEGEVERLVNRVALGFKGPLVFVSNEVGLGIVPENRLARQFRDHAGRLNQRLAAEADMVLFVAAGLPLELKG